MERNIQITEQRAPTVTEQQIELVERKGQGHPDSLADGISEAISQALCQEYRDRFGTIAHHNTDEVQIIGGESDPAYGGGTVTEPIYILLGGRATQEYQGESINVHGIAKTAARKHLDRSVRNLDVDDHVIIDSRIGEGSADLTDLYARDGEVPVANDTSYGVGHAPLSPTEELVLSLERHLNSDDFARTMPAVGEDIKVMALREDDRTRITLAAAFVDSEIDGINGYQSMRQELRDHVLDHARKHVDGELVLDINTADDYDRDSVYLTVTGTSAENGDDGSTGRGNRASGLITPKRPMSLEASSGKNPVAHVGKIYNIMSFHIAEKIAEEHNGLDDVIVKLLSQIGEPIDQPQIADIQVAMDGQLDSSTERSIQQTADHWLQNIDQVMDQVIEGERRTF
ncbi:MAG: methionine adenosyltransferase [Candidatus Nanohaloarchaea archaeon]|nr:methionine adenosyltransferase [Candidatus Nanohaloarchaea archaeon]